jgi:8-oxo-dGTP diphosphatase
MEVDWQAWSARERAVLCFIIHEHAILLIHKKTGLGAGKINGPGGRIEPGETELHAAVRECREETGLTPRKMQKAGVLHFQFTDGYSLHGTVFRAGDYRGTPAETAEAIPFWCPLGAIPFTRMWSDDVLWFPHLLSGKYFTGFFVFDGDRMLSARIEA